MTKRRGRPRRRHDAPLFHVRLDPEVADALRTRAAAEKRTVTAVVERSLLHYLESVEVDR
jgi:predicted HicB family RNase H-like nuclease